MYIHIPNWAENESLTLFIQKNTFQLHYKSGRRRCWLVLLSKLVDGLCQAVEPGVAGDQHQEDHGDHLHCAGEGEMLAKYEERKKKLESHLQVPSLLFSGTVSSLHLPSSMPFSFRGFSIEDSVLARLFLGVFVLEDIFFKFTGRGLMRVLLQCWFKHDCAISQAVCTWTVFVTQVALYFSSDNPHFIHAFNSLPCVLCLHQRDKRKTCRLLTLKTKPKNWAH